MSSVPNGNFAHYILTGDYPAPANRLIIGIYFEANPSTPSHNWACFIAASFYDQNNRVIWHKTVCLVLHTDLTNHGWSAVHGFDLGPPPPRETETGK